MSNARSGSGALAGPGRLLAGRLAVMALLVALILAVGVRPAYAEGEHIAGVTAEFGGDGTASSTFGTDIVSVAYQEANERLYVGGLGPATIHGFSVGGPGTFTPLGGNFPISLPCLSGFYGEVDVDNTAGASSNRLYLAPDCSASGVNNQTILAYTPTGTPYTSGWPVTTGGEACGMAVDNEGNVWGTRYSETTVKFSPAGAQLGTVPTAGGASQLCRQAVDLSNNDLFLSSYSCCGVWQYTAASNYVTKKQFTTFTGNSHVVVNSQREVVYVGGPNTSGTLRAYSTTTGELVETINGLGEIKGIAVKETDDTLYVADGQTERVKELLAIEAPKVTTGDPTANTTVSGTVDPDGAGEVIECYFRFGPTTAYGSEQPCEPATPYPDTGVQAVTAELPGLVNETTYHYRLVAKNANGPGFGKDKTITPHNVHNLKTEPATEITRSTAKLNASFDGTGVNTHYYFEWGPTAAYGNQTAAPPGDEAGVTTGFTTVSTALSGLTGGNGTTYHFRVVAENSSGVSMGLDQELTTQPSIKDLSTTPATNVQPTSATLNGSLDPDGFATTYYFEYGKTTDYGSTAPLPPGDPLGTVTPGDTPFSTTLTGLEPGTTYHFRAVGANSTGTTIATDDQEFTTPQPPSIQAFSSTNVTATSADLTATINPNDAETTYRFEYGTTTDYGSMAPAPDGVLPAGNTPQEISVPLTGLQGVTYHFKLVAESEWGTTESEDQTFDFNPPAGCPNHSVRQQTGAAYLPDCRAYELVSPANAAGAALFAEGAVSPYASNPGRFSFTAVLKAIPGTGEPINGDFSGDMYVASRTLNGWVTRYVGIPGYRSIGQSPPPGGEYGLFSWQATPTDRAMNRLLVWDRAQGAFIGGDLLGTYAPEMIDNEGNLLGRLPTNVEEVPGGLTDMTEGGFKGSVAITPDLSHYVFSAINVAFAPGGLTAPPGSAYDNDVGAKTVTLISKTSAGGDIPRDDTAGVAEEFIRIPAVSDDGSHILMSTAAPGAGNTHLYMRVNQAVSYDISVDQAMVNQGVKFEGMASDGTTVFFTTDQKMTADDTDTSIDLYIWTEATQSVTRVSDSGNIAGDTDSCSPTSGWTSKCNVVVVPVTPLTSKKFDSALAADTGELYFYSPELLDGARGFDNKRNLYVYRNGGVQHVATMEANQALTRINVPLDGRFMAFISEARLTSYDNAGFRQMYLYDPVARTIKCVSCVPSGDAPTFHVEGSLNGRFMTDDGRTFFSTKDSLVPRDANGIVDVYEFVVGRPQLISTGTGDLGGTAFQPIGLAGVSADGIDVFIATYETLVGQDENGAQLKFYDARTNGGFPFDRPPAPCQAADECHGPDSSAPAPLQTGTGANLGSGGNFSAKKKKKLKRRRCRKAKGKQAKRCRRKKASRRRHRASRRRHRSGRHG